jgi:hypothetical protein
MIGGARASYERLPRTLHACLSVLTPSSIRIRTGSVRVAMDGKH